MENKHVKTLSQATLKQSAAKGGCGECQTSCQSACKTSCTVANQECERQKIIDLVVCKRVSQSDSFIIMRYPLLFSII